MPALSTIRRFTSRDVNAFEISGGREKDWRFTPLKRLRGCTTHGPAQRQRRTSSCRALPASRARSPPAGRHDLVVRSEAVAGRGLGGIDGRVLDALFGRKGECAHPTKARPLNLQDGLLPAAPEWLPGAGSLRFQMMQAGKLPATPAPFEDEEQPIGMPHRGPGAAAHRPGRFLGQLPCELSSIYLSSMADGWSRGADRPSAGRPSRGPGPGHPRTPSPPFSITFSLLLPRHAENLRRVEATRDPKVIILGFAPPICLTWQDDRSASQDAS
jgi:hypothetical protein